MSDYKDGLVDEVAAVLWQEALTQEVENLKGDGWSIDSTQNNDFFDEFEDEIPPATVTEALAMVEAVEANYGLDIDEVSEQLDDYDELAFYIAMQSLGHGVAWSDNHDDELKTDSLSADDTAMLADGQARKYFSDQEPENDLEPWTGLEESSFDNIIIELRGVGRLAAAVPSWLTFEKLDLGGFRLHEMVRAFGSVDSLRNLNVYPFYAQVDDWLIRIARGIIENPGHAPEVVVGYFRVRDETIIPEIVDYWDVKRLLTTRTFPDELSARRAQMRGDDVVGLAEVATTIPSPFWVLPDEPDEPDELVLALSPFAKKVWKRW
jgi:hypothetical protein